MKLTDIEFFNALTWVAERIGKSNLTIVKNDPKLILDILSALKKEELLEEKENEIDDIKQKRMTYDAELSIRKEEDL